MTRIMRLASRPFAIPAQRRNSHLLHLRLPPGRAWLIKGLMFLAFAALDAAQQRASQLALDHDRLQVELRALSVPSRIESLARGQLGMVPITPARSDYVSAAQLPGLPPSIPTR